MFSHSVRTRTTLLASLIVGVTLAIGAAVLVVTLGQALTRNSDNLARTRAQDVAGLVAAGALPKMLANVDGEGVAQVVDESGRVLAASENIAGRGPMTTVRPPGPEPVALTIRNAPDDEETEDYRVWALTATSADGPVTVYVGGSLESFEEASRALYRALLVAVPLGLALLALGTWLVIGRALRPVEAIRTELTSITDEATGRRVPVPDSDDEVARLAVTMNSMLDRLEAAGSRQRDFVADASHELQSPLAAIRVQLEVALAHPGDADWPAIAANLLEEGTEMERLVRDLLFLAREHDVETSPIEPLDLDDIVIQEAQRAQASTAIRLETSDVSGAPVQARRDDLRRLVRNLIENAVQHARSTVMLTVSTRDGQSRLDVTDDGPGVLPEDRERVFDRFYRADVSRSRRSGGTGLGLAIARTIAERHRGTLTLTGSDAGAHFVLLLPADAADAADARGSLH